MKGAVAIDANLLVLLIVGYASPSYIRAHKRLRDTFTEEDFRLLVEIVNEYSDIVLLPNTLTELSNLIRYIDNPARRAVLLCMKAFVARFGETYVSSQTGVARPEFLSLGLTDAILLELACSDKAGKPPTLLTVDLDLAIAAEMNGLAVENFNHYR